MFFVLLIVFLSIRAIAHSANIYRPLGYWLVGIHSREYIPLNCTTASGVFVFAVDILTFMPGSLHAPFTVAFVPNVELRSVAEWVNVHFCHITQISSCNARTAPRGWGKANP